jgi:hypothetical protein
MSSKDSGLVSPPSSAASDDFMSGLPSDDTNVEPEGFGSLIVAGSSAPVNGSVLSIDASPHSVRSSFAVSLVSQQTCLVRRASASQEIYEEADRNCVPPRRSGDELVRRLTRALEVASYELRKTELELREALLEIARLRDKCAESSASKHHVVPKTRRSGSCPITSTHYALPLPTAALFSVIHRVYRQDSY